MKKAADEAKPVVNAMVWLEGSDKKTKTNDKGEFKLDGVPVGKKFALVAEKPDMIKHPVDQGSSTRPSGISEPINKQTRKHP